MGQEQNKEKKLITGYPALVDPDIADANEEYYRRSEEMMSGTETEGLYSSPPANRYLILLFPGFLLVLLLGLFVTNDPLELFKGRLPLPRSETGFAGNSPIEAKTIFRMKNEDADRNMAVVPPIGIEKQLSIFHVDRDGNRELQNEL